MTDAPTGALVAVVAVAVLLAAVLAAGETALLRLGRPALAELEASDRPSARRVRRLAEDAPASAAAAGWARVLLEVTAAVALTLALAGTGLPWAAVAGLALVLSAAGALLVVRLGPRTLARDHPGAVARATSGALAVAAALAGPLHRALPAASFPHEQTDDELREMVDRVSESEHIEADEREMFRSVLELGETITRAVMVPRTEMITLASGTPLRKALSLFLRSGYSRVPVVGESVDDLLGVLYLKDVLRHRQDHPRSDDDAVDPLLRPPVFVPESKPVDDLLREMQQGSFHMALVVDEFGGIAGLVTIEDALEEIVGELTDEHDRSAPEVEHLPDGSVRIPARMPLDELGELFDLELEDADVDTAGGLLAKALGKVPLSGSSAVVDGVVLTADRVEGRRKQVATLLVARAGAADDAPDGRAAAPDESTTTTSSGAPR